jgi:two-component system LytT family sensor kinase
LLRARVEARAALERARALRAQLNPHFLFNSLNGIASLSEVQSPAAQELVTQLSDLLRRTLRASEYEQHPLSEELAYIQAYLRIQQIRQPLRISWQLQVDEQCRAACVPTLILLPLVENAVTHGLRGGECNVHVDISVKRERDHLLMRISNTCCGEATPETIGGSGLGLRNVRERLQIIFGGRATLTASRSRPDYFEAQVQIP